MATDVFFLVKRDPSMFLCLDTNATDSIVSPKNEYHPPPLRQDIYTTSTQHSELGVLGHVSFEVKRAKSVLFLRVSLEC